MTRGVYVAASGAESGVAAIALGAAELLSGAVDPIGVFRPVVAAGAPDPVVQTLRRRFKIAAPYERCVGVDYDAVHADPDAATAEIIDAYQRLARDCAAVVAVGTDYTDVGAPTEFTFNARVAANLGLPVLLAVSGAGREPRAVRDAIALAAKEVDREHAARAGTVVDRVEPERVAGLRAALAGDAWVLPEVPGLTAPTVRDLLRACEGRLLFGEEQRLGRETSGLLVAAMSLPNVLDRLEEDHVVLVAADRAGALLPALAAAHRSADFPTLAGVVLTGDLGVSEPVWRLLSGMDLRLPVIASAQDTFTTATRLAAVRGAITPDADRKTEAALAAFGQAVDGPALLSRLQVDRTEVVTPLMFEHTLLTRARARPARIVLAEGTEERVLRAAEVLLRREAAELVLLGRPREVAARAAEFGLDVGAAEVVSPDDPELRERFAAEYARLRAHKGVTEQLARDTVGEVSYFGTLMVHCGLADGMVSGAAHTTAQTIRPSFEILRTSLVSSVFFMSLPDRVLVYGDCAVNPDPSAEDLARIAADSADTAARFGVEPRVAMLSYSTGASGTGADVDKVRRATEAVRAARPDLLVEGPIQYDAAIDPDVARAKLPGSAVAGHATVFIAPDLNTGNILYKGVQRSAGAVAVGPVLQGLRRPVNDLSRGATVQDIVNTVAITAVQAHAAREEPPPPRPEQEGTGA
ncbi:phosphate acetyltransferase [Streptomonospora nanhaiensis]|uniref:phosphate acetyltransferase n=1 Tax=Streptomonospora nanhaiensis TaxID=1323731 RepID=UPI001C3943BC|nr:phosphate acetyltransferase [Streptomonospora nanhaiensis]MBV2365835.1 phosphate acetyltransferase [Streptomonospora nanhaiensis]